MSLSTTEAEAKRLVLAFESRQVNEINWALNTLVIFSCNTGQNFTLDTQPYLLESLANYMLFCVENITTYNYEDPLRKRDNIISYDIGTLAYVKDAPEGVKPNNLDYEKPGSLHDDFKELRKREAKAEAKQRMLDSMVRASSRKVAKSTQKSGESPLEELRNKRKRMVTLMYQEISELELIEHLHMIVLILRNLSFVRANELNLIRCSKLMNVIVSLFVDLEDREITMNCLDILTNVGRHLLLSDLNCGELLVHALFFLFQSNQYLLLEDPTKDEESEVMKRPPLVDQCIETLRRLSHLSGNEEYLERLTGIQLQRLVDLLVNRNPETREGVLELLFTISDRQTSLKVKIAKKQRCIERLIGLIATGA